MTEFVATACRFNDCVVRGRERKRVVQVSCAYQRTRCVAGFRTETLVFAWVFVSVFLYRSTWWRWCHSNDRCRASSLYSTARMHLLMGREKLFPLWKSTAAVGFVRRRFFDFHGSEQAPVCSLSCGKIAFVYVASHERGTPKFFPMEANGSLHSHTFIRYEQAPRPQCFVSTEEPRRADTEYHYRPNPHLSSHLIFLSPLIRTESATRRNTARSGSNVLSFRRFHVQ